MKIALVWTTLLSSTAVVSCAGGAANGPGPNAGNQASEAPATAEEIEQAKKPCGTQDEVHQHDLHGGASTDAFVPCSSTGAHDYSALVKVETVEHGVHIIIDARDDEVTILGPDVKERDAVIVYPKGQGSKGIDVPLIKTKTGYHGDKIVFWDDLGKLTDDGTKIDVAIYDHDKVSGSHEQLHVQVAVSTGKSCEKAEAENMQTIDMNNKSGGKADLTKEQLGAPIRTTSFMASCNLPDEASADICVAIKSGKPVGVSVNVTPSNNKVAACTIGLRGA
jgi:hypothetical protein